MNVMRHIMGTDVFIYLRMLSCCRASPQWPQLKKSKIPVGVNGFLFICPGVLHHFFLSEFSCLCIIRSSLLGTRLLLQILDHVGTFELKWSWLCVWFFLNHFSVKMTFLRALDGLWLSRFLNSMKMSQHERGEQNNTHESQREITGNDPPSYMLS